jgi:hypothetical protein
LTPGGVAIAPAVAVATSRPHMAVIVAVVTVALVAIACWGALWWSKKDLRDAAEAIQSLRDIQSVAQVGVNHGEFSMRFHNAQIKVDRYLRDHQSTKRTIFLRGKIAKTVVIYGYAENVWSDDIAEKTTLTNQDWGYIWEYCGDEYESAGISIEEFTHSAYSRHRDVPILFKCASRILDEK